jgi:hypothetical protein
MKAFLLSKQKIKQHENSREALYTHHLRGESLAIYFSFKWFFIEPENNIYLYLYQVIYLRSFSSLK